jgi:hypothetical protein
MRLCHLLDLGHRMRLLSRLSLMDLLDRLRLLDLLGLEP